MPSNSDPLDAFALSRRMFGACVRHLVPSSFGAADVPAVAPTCNTHHAACLSGQGAATPEYALPPAAGLLRLWAAEPDAVAVLERGGLLATQPLPHRGPAAGVRVRHTTQGSLHGSKYNDDVTGPCHLIGTSQAIPLELLLPLPAMPQSNISPWLHWQAVLRGAMRGGGAVPGSLRAQP